MVRFGIGLIVSFFLAHSATAESLVDATIPIFSQKLGIKVEKGWKTGDQQSTPAVFLLEIIPGSEKIESWTKMLTVTGYRGLASKMSIEDAYKTEADSVVNACPKDAINKIIKSTNAQGYDSVTAIVGCKKHPQLKGRNEVGFYNFIKGKEDIYMVKKSFREVIGGKNTIHLDESNYTSLAAEFVAMRLCKNDGQGPTCVEEE